MDYNFFGISGNTIIIWLVLGLIVGVLAKYLVPGKDPGGLITTSLTGVAGAFLGGAIASYFGIASEVGTISFMSVLTAIIGSMVLLIALRVLKFLI